MQLSFVKSIQKTSLVYIRGHEGTGWYTHEGTGFAKVLSLVTQWS
jgi:hypothetical protein